MSYHINISPSHITSQHIIPDQITSNSVDVFLEELVVRREFAIKDPDIHTYLNIYNPNMYSTYSVLYVQ